jgi:hypothetical protein
MPNEKADSQLALGMTKFVFEVEQITIPTIF